MDIQDVLDEINIRIVTNLHEPRTWTVAYSGATFDLSMEGAVVAGMSDQYFFNIGRCINFTYLNKNEIDLGLYYLNEGCSGKLIMPHETFFSVLDMIGRKLNVHEIHLQDASYKDLKICKLPVYIFALAGYKTFYERYGFENPAFDEHINRISMLPLSEFLIERTMRTKSRVDSILNDFAPYTKDTPVYVVARYIVDTCKRAFKPDTRKRPFTVNTQSDIRHANKLLHLINSSYPNVEIESIKRLGGNRIRKTRRFSKDRRHPNLTPYGRMVPPVTLNHVNRKSVRKPEISKKTGNR